MVDIGLNDSIPTGVKNLPWGKRNNPDHEILFGYVSVLFVSSIAWSSFVPPHSALLNSVSSRSLMASLI